MFTPFTQELSLALSKKEKAQILGVILHYSLEDLLKRWIFWQITDQEDLAQRLIKSSLRLYPEPFPEREELASQAIKILQNFLSAQRVLTHLSTLVSTAKRILIEPELYSAQRREILRPDVVILREDALILLEIKLNLKDFSEEQVKAYETALKEIFPEHNFQSYLLSFNPPKLWDLKKEIQKDGENLPSARQLALFG